MTEWIDPSMCETHLVVIGVELHTAETLSALEAAGPFLPAALLVGPCGDCIGEEQDPSSGVLCSDNDVRRWIGGDVAGENGGVDDEEVVRAVDARVEVDDGIAVVTSVLRAELAGS